MADRAACAAALKNRQRLLARLRKLSELDRLWRKPERTADHPKPQKGAK